jgi:5-hydroxyisourate hydrolase-like protein (transthyretin family)
MARPRFWIASGMVLALASAAALATSTGARAQTQPAAMMLTQTTPSYTIALDIGPAAEMVTLDQAQAMGMGEVMVEAEGMGMAMASGSSSAMSGGSTPMMSSDESGMMPMMATTDNGQPVNHDLEVHVLDKATGAPVEDAEPQITITDESSGQSRTLADVAAMYDVQRGMSDLHFGNNVFLPDGTYTVTVTLVQETATFQHVAVSNGMGLSMDGMGTSTPGSAMPSGH